MEKNQLKVPGDLAHLRTHFLKAEKPSKCICSSRLKLIDTVAFSRYLFTLDLWSRKNAQSSPKWKSCAWSAKDL